MEIPHICVLKALRYSPDESVPLSFFVLLQPEVHVQDARHKKTGRKRVTRVRISTKSGQDGNTFMPEVVR